MVPREDNVVVADRPGKEIIAAHKRRGILHLQNNLGTAEIALVSVLQKIGPAAECTRKVS